MNRSRYYLEDGRLRPAWRFFLSILMLFGAGLAASGIGMLFAGKNMRLLALIARPLWMVFLLWGYAWMLRVLDRVPERRLPAMGLPGGKRAIGDSLFGVLLGSAMVLLTVAIIAWTGNLQVAHDVHGIPTGSLLIEVLVVLSTAAMGEEIAFRGYPFQRLVEATGPGGAIALMSALFGAIHLGNPNASTLGLLNTMLVGILFSLAYLRSRALWLPWGMHWAWNAVLGAGIGLPVSGIDMSAGIRSRATGAAWLTGGAYGPEASVGCTVAVLVALAVVLVAYHRPPESFSVAEHGTGDLSIQPK